MAIFGNKRSSLNDDFDISKYDHIQPTTEALEQIITESAKDSYKLRAGMYVSDVMMEQAVLFESADPEVLLEAFGKGFFAKVKDMFVKMWNAVKAWFEKMKKSLVMFFSSGKTFVDKFENDLRKKNVKGYKYKSFKYTASKGDAFASKILSTIDSTENEYENKLGGLDVRSSSKHKDAMDSKKDNMKEEYDTNDDKESLFKSMGVDSISELQEESYQEYRNGSKEKEEFEDFENNSKDDMMKFIKDSSKNLADLERYQKDMDSHFSKIVKAIETAGNKYKNEEFSKVSPYVSHSVEMLRFCMSIRSALSKMHVEYVKEAASEFESILKGYLRFKPLKESLDVSHDDKTDTTNIFEAAMRLV